MIQKDFVIFLWLSVRKSLATSFKANASLSDMYRGTSRVVHTISMVSDYLEKYPYSKNYLLETWIRNGRVFDHEGFYKGSDEPVFTYVAYAVAHSRLAETSRLAGLADILPDDSAALGSINHGNSKPEREKLYRFYKNDIF